ncbi:spermidine/spermine N1-acetyltransferase 2, isoform CRA_b [Homo sapiens]|nr:spermidine/spermine N1-acetyltransferase 2, isoform CRA_b [Homo sapiens]
MASVRIREAKEGDCGDILRLIRVKTAGRPESRWLWRQSFLSLFGSRDSSSAREATGALRGGLWDILFHLQYMEGTHHLSGGYLCDAGISGSRDWFQNNQKGG